MANVPIYTNQGGTQMTVGSGATLTVEGTLATSGSGSITVADGSITKAKTAMFISATQTGDGMNEVLAHGLGVDPTTANVFISVMDTLTNTVGDFNAAIVSTDATNVTVNVTTGVLYRVMAWAP